MTGLARALTVESNDINLKSIQLIQENKLASLGEPQFQILENIKAGQPLKLPQEKKIFYLLGYAQRDGNDICFYKPITSADDGSTVRFTFDQKQSEDQLFSFIKIPKKAFSDRTSEFAEIGWVRNCGSGTSPKILVVVEPIVYDKKAFMDVAKNTGINPPTDKNLLLKKTSDTQNELKRLKQSTKPNAIYRLLNPPRIVDFGQGSIKFDGKDDQGNYIPNGDYLLAVDLYPAIRQTETENTVKTEYAGESKKIRQINFPLRVTHYSGVTGQYLIPTDKGRSDPVAIGEYTYTITDISPDNGITAEIKNIKDGTTYLNDRQSAIQLGTVYREKQGAHPLTRKNGPGKSQFPPLIFSFSRFDINKMPQEMQKRLADYPSTDKWMVLTVRQETSGNQGYPDSKSATDYKEVYATTFCTEGSGVEGSSTATGISCPNFRNKFVALPAPLDLTRNKKVEVCFNGRCTVGTVGDIGPWCENDIHYVFGPSRPFAEINQDKILANVPGGEYVPGARRCNGQYYSNGAGIDLSYVLAKEIGYRGKPNKVKWRFVSNTP